MTESADRHARGLDAMTRIHGTDSTAQILENFRTISPMYADYVVEAGFADIYDRPALTSAQRQLLNIAILTTLGDAAPQLATHIRGALRVGITGDQVIETIIHTSLYAGHPRAGAALAVANDVLTNPRPTRTPSMADQTTSADEQFVTLPDASRLAVQLHGAHDAPTVLMIAGVAAAHTTWGTFPTALASTFRVITYDHRGTGTSDDSTTDALTTRSLAQDASNLLAALGVPEAHVYGHSMGARVAQWLAIDHPEQVTTLTLGAGTGGDRLGVPRPEEATRALSTGDPDAIAHCALGPSVADDPAARSLLGTQHTSPEALAHHVAASTHHDAWDDLHRIGAPTLILHGTADRMTPVENARRLADAIPHATLHLLTGAGHGYFVEPNDSTQAFISHAQS